MTQVVKGGTRLKRVLKVVDVIQVNRSKKKKKKKRDTLWNFSFLNFFKRRKYIKYNLNQLNLYIFK